jgi:hypothetical protein
MGVIDLFASYAAQPSATRTHKSDPAGLDQTRFKTAWFTAAFRLVSVTSRWGYS